MKSLFNSKYETYNDEAHILSKKAHDVLRPIIKEYSKIGYPVYEIQDILLGELVCLCSETRLRKAINKRKEDKNRKPIPASVFYTNMNNGVQ